MSPDPMAAQRLRAARAAAGFDSAADAARALGVGLAGYTHHENGTRALIERAPLYAQRFGVTLDWLLLGRGSMTGATAIPICGAVGAGETLESAEIAAAGESVELPRPSESDAYVVRGDSMQPRFFRGEILIFARRPSPIRQLVGQICRAELRDGRSFVKILRGDRAPDRWRLDSIRLYEPMIEDVEIKSVHRWLALLPPRHVDAFILARRPQEEDETGAKRSSG